MQILPKLGITVKQYGKFHVREVRSEQEQQPLEMFQISLEQAGAQELFIGYIPIHTSGLPYLKQRIRFWIMEQQSQLNQVEQWASETFDAQKQEKLQELTAMLELKLQEVQRALRAIDHDYDHQ